MLWDGTGQNWATIMVGETTAAHVFMFGPLNMMVEQGADAALHAVSSSVPFIRTQDMDAVELRADPGALVTAFGDLWFSTI